MNILSADLLRIMRNVSPLCTEEERTNHVQHFIHRMQYSGYSVQDRVDVYRNARRRYESILKNDRDGIVPLYRGKFWELEERTRKKREKADNWYKSGGYETVMFVDATPNEKLANECRKIVRNAGLKIRIVEKAGTSVKRSVVKSNPFGKQPCECEVCKLHSSSKIDCKQRGVVYENKCQGIRVDGDCKSFYVGETSRSVGERFGEHMEKYSSRDQKSVFWSHANESHGGNRQPIGLSILSNHPGDAMLRQVTEAIHIETRKPDLNRKDEWGNRNVPRKRKDASENSHH